MKKMQQSWTKASKSVKSSSYLVARNATAVDDENLNKQETF